ncbi:Fe2+-dependent dioxygenase [Thioclava sp. FTW29]|uniref:Fe2+-dependent dioxygenase n=1 Tax=Thioclava litoralis TaxID=3076557 RepID=A0ABZ1E4E2_9RHOB|nr:Fe2+-dependent dioxygenase [Thioclava sp. FTW29]
MLIHVPNILSAEDVAQFRHALETSQWADGRLTAGDLAAQSKHNLQIPADSEIAQRLGEHILRALARNDLYNAAALPLRVLPPMFNRYDTGMTFGAHTDNAIRTVAGGARLRADVSTTIFLTDPEAYDGGELVIEDTFGQQRVKLPAGDMIVYPSSSLHHVTPVTRGSRWASFFWAQSMVREDDKRAMLYNLDTAIRQMRATYGDEGEALQRFVSHYHNLVRLWAEL